MEDQNLNKLNQDNAKSMLDTTIGIQGEYDIGNGVYLQKILFILALSNFAIISHRLGKSNCSKMFWGSVFLSAPIAALTSKYIFGVQKFRDLEKEDNNTLVSTQHWNNNSKH